MSREGSRTKGEMNMNLYVATDEVGRPIRFYMTVGEVNDHTGARALLSGLPSADWYLDPSRDIAARYPAWK